ncbi:MAG TPA: hypothetical protein PKN36_09805 [bacterium]|nr:hypothetical protein [bacterium]
MKKIIFFTALIAAAAIVFCPQAMAVGTPAGTVIQNQAYADYNDANGNPKTRVYSDWVYTTVSQVAGVEIMPETASQSGMAGDTVYFGVTVTNTGNGTDTFALGVTDTAWSSVIYLDDNGDGIWDEMNETTVVNTTGPLAADTSYKVIVVTTIPIDAEDMATSIATLTATSQFNNAVSDIGTYTTTAESAVFDVVKYVVDTPENPVPGDIITYKITGTNAGSAATDNIRAEDAIPAGTTYVAGSMRVGMIGDSYSAAMPITDADDGNEIEDIGGYFTGTKVVYTKGAFAPAGTGSFFFQVQVNEGVLETTVISNQLTAYYKHENLPTEYTSSSNTTSTTIGLKAAVDLDPDGVKYNINPGDQVIYPFTATNNGNAADRINVTTSSTMGWTWAIWVDSDTNGIPGTNGDYLLTDTNADGIIDTGILTPNGGSINLLAVATVPAGTNDGEVDVTTVTGTSVRDNTVSDSITLTTNVIAPVLSISKSVSPEGNQPPGTVLTYTVTVTNTGHGTATSVAIFDLVPTYTTFVPGSIKAGSTLATLDDKTDASDGDGGRYDSNSHTVNTGSGISISLGPNGTWVLQFQVTID